jgi:hypothetical protein
MYSIQEVNEADLKSYMYVHVGQLKTGYEFI